MMARGQTGSLSGCQPNRVPLTRPELGAGNWACHHGPAFDPFCSSEAENAYYSPRPLATLSQHKAAARIWPSEYFQRAADNRSKKAAGRLIWNELSVPLPHRSRFIFLTADPMRVLRRGRSAIKRAVAAVRAADPYSGRWPPARLPAPSAIFPVCPVGGGGGGAVMGLPQGFRPKVSARTP